MYIYEVVMKNQKSHIDPNQYTLNYLKKFLGADSLCDSDLPNIINWKREDIKKLELGTKELRLKEINLITQHYRLNVDDLFPNTLVKSAVENYKGYIKKKKRTLRKKPKLKK